MCVPYQGCRQPSVFMHSLPLDARSIVCSVVRPCIPKFANTICRLEISTKFGALGDNGMLGFNVPLDTPYLVILAVSGRPAQPIID